MAWSVELSEAADRTLDKLDPQIARRILKFLDERVSRLDDPRSIGEALRGPKLGELWKYRVGDFRLICDLQDDRLLVLVLRVGNRREIYRQR
jgi:mRNA interferase RelE/StbE